MSRGGLSLDLDGRVLLVTGGATGIGFATALLRGVTTPALEALGIRSRELRTLLGEARARDRGKVPHQELAS